MSAKKVLHPTVLWAQRDLILYLTIEVEDMKIADLTISDKSLHVKCASPALVRPGFSFQVWLQGREWHRVGGVRVHVGLLRRC